MTSSETGQTSPGDAGCMASVGSNLAPGVTTLAGNGRNADTDGTGGPNGTAEFSQPFSLAFGADCNVYVADVFGIRKVESDGEVTTIVGGGEGPISGITLLVSLATWRAIFTCPTKAAIESAE